MKGFKFQTTGLVPPCKDCPDRHGGCHAECEKWKEYEQKKFIALSKKIEEIDRRNNMYQPTVGGARRRRKYDKERDR